MSAIFLSYRRGDSSGYAGRLFDNIAERFGREQVFMDIEMLDQGPGRRGAPQRIDW